MARPIWNGTLSFGLLNIPIQLMPGERKADEIHFRMLDARNKAPVRYERVNAETGEEVPWKDIVKAFEYDKGNYVVLDPEDIKAASSDGKEAVEIEAFVDLKDIGLRHFEKPYVLVPGKKAEKGYVLLRETLRKTGKAGIARVVVRQREYLAAVVPHEDAIILMLLRYQQELVSLDEFKLPEGKASDYRVSPKEIEMATQLIESMSVPWNPADSQDDYRERLRAVIDKRMKSEGVVSPDVDDDVEREGIATNVVDFESLLKKSISENKRTPARKAAAKKAPAKRAGKAAKAAKKPAARKRKSA